DGEVGEAVVVEVGDGGRRSKRCRAGAEPEATGRRRERARGSGLRSGRRFSSAGAAVGEARRNQSTGAQQPEDTPTSNDSARQGDHRRGDFLYTIRAVATIFH